VKACYFVTSRYGIKFHCMQLCLILQNGSIYLLFWGKIICSLFCLVEVQPFSTFDCILVYITVENTCSFIFIQVDILKVRVVNCVMLNYPMIIILFKLLLKISTKTKVLLLSTYSLLSVSVSVGNPLILCFSLCFPFLI